MVNFEIQSFIVKFKRPKNRVPRTSLARHMTGKWRGVPACQCSIAVQQQMNYTKAGQC